MSVNRPFFRCVRPGVDGDYSRGGRWMYICHPNYAIDATHYLRAYSLLQDDLLRLFEYVEPADINEATYSYRCLELLIRACGEVEANCRAILDANGYESKGRLNMEDYRKLNPTHHLSSYQVRLPVWTGMNFVRQPFAAWEHSGPLPWFQAHHGGKHNRQAEFPSASFGNIVDAVAGVLVLLSAQFHTYDFKPMSLAVTHGYERTDGFEDAIGGYFAVRFPDDWAPEDRYDFNWREIDSDPSPFQRLSL